MAQRARRKGITGAAVRAARAVAALQDEMAAQVSQRVYNAIVQAKYTGEAGDVSPLLWGPLVIAGEMIANVVISANGLPDDEETRVDVAAYFVAGALAGAHGFDFEHFERWRQSDGISTQTAVEPG